MPVTERLRAAGSWSLNLREDTPKSILDDLNIATQGFGLLIITPARIPSTALTAALLRGMSRYVGVYRARPNDYSMAGAHASILLGDEDGKGEILSAAATNAGASLSTWMTALLPSNGIAKGTVSGGSTLTATYQYMSRRQAIDAVCDGCGADWLVRCNSAGDLVVDASPKATLFGSAAVALATRRALGGKDPAIASLRATQLATAMDVEDYTTKVWLLARAGGDTTVGTATAGSVPYFGPGGAAIKMERVIDAPNVDTGNETTIATLQLANFSTLRRAITLSTDEYDISGVVRPGQNIYVYDPIINLYDNAVEQYFRGETIHPILLRCFGHTWPIRAGFGVYFQTPEASPRIINLSDWVIPEDGDTTVEVGALSRQVGAGPVTLGTAFGSAMNSTWNQAWGVLGYVEVTASQNTISAAVDLTSLTLTTTFVANRRILLSGQCIADQVTTAGVTSFLITDATPTIVGQSQQDIVAAKRAMCLVSAVVTPAAGSKLYKLRMSTTAGTVNMVAAANAPAWFKVEDIGPNGNPA